jgi:uncharacterized delta-60 repeat protein
MTINKPANNGGTSVLRGVSTLDSKYMRAVLLFLVIIAFCGPVRAGHSILDRVDPSFNPEIEANLYGLKTVTQIQAAPDGKILAMGNFTSYDRIPVGKFVRLNADGSLDTAFNNQTITSILSFDPRSRIIVLLDGKIIVKCQNIVANDQDAKHLVRLNSDGTLDTGFNYTLNSNINTITVDSLGRILIAGNFQTPLGARYILRLSADGSIDDSFNYTTGTSSNSGNIAAQGTKVIVAGFNSGIFRVNENGSLDPTFSANLPANMSASDLIVQPDNKILYMMDALRRLNENGSSDDTFQSPAMNVSGPRLAADGKIIAIIPVNQNQNTGFGRFLPNGEVDPSFTPYIHRAWSSYAVQPDGGLVIGDQSNPNLALPVNNFVRLTPFGAADPAFNPGGLGFQIILPGSIRAIEPQPDGKILLGGKIDVVNGVERYRLARINTDSTTDLSFQVNTSGSGNYFTRIMDIYQIRAQSDGKIVVSGFFDYFLKGVAKRNLVRLNSDGSIDATFNVAVGIPDYSEIVGAGRNRFLTLSDNGLLLGISKLNGFGQPGPWKFTAAGLLDPSFNSTLNPTSPQMYIDDVAIQPDGKVLVSGSHQMTSGVSPVVSFVARLNTDGSTDPTFLYSEEPNRLRSTLALLPNGKILIGKHAEGTLPGRVERLNGDGSPDASFNALSMPSAIINALLVLPNGKIFVGGSFTLTINGQQARNLLQLSEDGDFEPIIYNLNSEVLCLAADSDGRVLVGGGFTVIGANGEGADRSYVARLTDRPPQYDFDGDGKTDVGVFRPGNGNWYLSQSQNGLSIQNFGLSGDVVTPGDFDGDGKSDLAIWRPSTGTWWYMSTVNGGFYAVTWGQAGDIPLAEDFNGDGKSDFVIYRPLNNIWFRFGSNGQYAPLVFGTAGDIPLVADMDGDGKADPTVYRPSTGTWWYASSVNGLFYALQWGTAGDIPVPGDYDGDGKTDPAYFRPSNGAWYIVYSHANYTTFVVTAWGVAGDQPTPGDYDGDGKNDLAIYRPSTGMWFAMRSTSGFFSQQFGLLGDKAVPNAFLPNPDPGRTIVEKKVGKR